MTLRSPWLGLSLALLALLPGCGRSGKTKLAFVTNNPHGFWTYAQRGCEKAAAEFDVELQFRRPSESSAREQQQIVEDLLLVGVKGIAISPNDPANSMDFYRSKVSSQVPLIAADNDIPDPKVRRCYIGTHNYRAGRAAGDLVMKALPKGGKIAIFVGQMDAPNAVERRQGLLDVLSGLKQEEIDKKTPPDAKNLNVGNYELIETVTDEGKEKRCQEKAEDFLIVNKDVECLIGLWEYNPPALIRAVEKAGVRPVIIGFDENFQTLQAIIDGKAFGTVVQNPFQFGYDSIKILAHLAKGDEGILKQYPVDDKNRIYIPHRIITSENVGPFFEQLKKQRGES